MRYLTGFLILFVFLSAQLLVRSAALADISGTPCSIPSSVPASSPQPTTGTIRALFIFVKFSDDTFENDCTEDWDHVTYNTTRPPWTNQIIDASLMSNQTPSSLSDYFDLVSFGQFRMIGDIFPQDNLVYVPPHPQSYYVRNISYPAGDPLRRGIGYLNSEILKDLVSVIDYQNYDTNPNDNVLDMVFIMYRIYDISTEGGCNGGSYSGIATLDPCNDGFFPITLDGVQINCGVFGSGVTIRTALQLNDLRELLAHEYGHHWFGATHFGTGTQVQNGNMGWFGYSNGKAAGRGAFDKVKLGWVTPTTITANTPGLPIDDLATHSNAVYKVLIPGQTNRYFLLENRQRTNLYEQQWTGAAVI